MSALTRRLAILSAVTAATTACGPDVAEGQVTAVAADEVCVATQHEDVCFDPADVDGAGDLAPDACVELVRMAESGDVAEVRPCRD